MKTILHLCADLGSDSKYYQLDPEYQVILIGESIGVENYIAPENVHGIIANPVCTEFSTAKGFHKENDIEKGSQQKPKTLTKVEKSSETLLTTALLWCMLKEKTK